MGRIDPGKVTGQSVAAMNLLPIAFFLATAAAQDTHYCADGWDLYTTTWHGQEHHSCFWFGNGDEQMSWKIANLACNAMGAYLAEVPYGPSLNHWLGARDHGHHD